MFARRRPTRCSIAAAGARARCVPTRRSSQLHLAPAPGDRCRPPSRVSFLLHPQRRIHNFRLNLQPLEPYSIVRNTTSQARVEKESAQASARTPPPRLPSSDRPPSMAMQVLYKELLHKDLLFKLHPLPRSTYASGYIPPLGSTEDLPFHVERTSKGNLPVYAKRSSQADWTVVRRYYGNESVRSVFSPTDTQILRRELGVVSSSPVQVRTGEMWIKGAENADLVKVWLQLLGF